MERQDISAPKVAREPARIVQHGVERTDEFGWMRTPDWAAVVRDPDALPERIRHHLDAENAYAQAVLAPMRDVEESLYQAMVAGIAQDEASPPFHNGEWTYFTRYDAASGGEHVRHFRRNADREELLLDEPARAEGRSFYSCRGAQPSRDNRYYAWAEDIQGGERFTIHVHHAGGGPSRAPIADCAGRFVFSPCGGFVVWAARGANGHPTEIRMAPVEGGAARVIHAEADPAFYPFPAVTASGAFLVLKMFNDDCNESWLIPADDPMAAPRCVEPRRSGLRYDVEEWCGKLLIRTNLDSEAFRLMTAEPERAGAAHWRPWVVHPVDGTIEDVRPYRDFVLLLERHEGRARPWLLTGETDAPTPLPLEIGAMSALVDDVAFDTPRALYSTWSFVRPTRVNAFDLATKELEKLWEQPGAGIDAGRYETVMSYAEASDSARVPISLLKLRTTPRDGSAPLLLYGYGAYGHCCEPSFDPAILSLVDRGWVYAIAHVRGGGENGRGWHEAGRGRSKPNSFSDFVACADRLVQERYTCAGRIVAQGASAGGLLVGAALDLAPGLFGAVIAEVPFVDVLNSQSDYSLPLTQPERAEWGDPKNASADHAVIAAYAPYETVGAKPYPPVLATTGISDGRVPYWEAAKWIARLRDRSTSASPFLLETLMESGGHGGASGRLAEFRHMAHVYAFAEWALG